MLDFLVVSARAEAAAAPPGASPFGPFIMLGGMLIIFYFLMWRPQSKRAKEHKKLLEGLGKGDEVVLSGGLMGRVVRVDEQYAVIEIGAQASVEVRVQKTSIASALPKGTLKAI